MSLVGKTNAEKAWNFIIRKTKNSYGTAGLVGNIFIDSDLIPTTSQHPTLSEEEYVQVIDDGTYTDFINDNVAFGLMQWQKPKDKEKLLAYARNKGQSIGDFETQLEFLCRQLQREYYAGVWRVLKHTDNIREASDAIVENYKNLTEESEDTLEIRAFMCAQYYELFEEQITDEPEVDPIQDLGLEQISNITIIEPTTFSSTLHQVNPKTLMDVYEEPKYTLDNGPTQCIMTNSTCYKMNKPLNNPIGVVIHSTGINSPYLKRFVQPSANDENYEELISLLGYNSYGNDWNHSEAMGGAHIWIGKTASDKIEAIQTLPWDIQGMECGAGPHGTANDRYIQIQICEGLLNNKMYFTMIYQELIHILAYLCDKFHFNPINMTNYDKYVVPTILCHQDAYKYGLASNCADIYHWFNKHDTNMNDIREATEKLLLVLKPTDQYIATVSHRTVSIYDNMKIGDTFKLINGAKYIDDRIIPGWIFKSTLYVRDIKEKTIVFSTVRDGDIIGEVAKEFVLPIAEVINYKVRINTSLLNVREQPSLESTITMVVAQDDIYTIVDEQDGWGKLSSGEGWILLKWTQRVKEEE